ncbi:hypothetical protein FA95DRAFT_884371 [Auriscalpium vulgare]|uniref:Uncharacterized protein n=1 Tax=Auriscalpium vulgare TaxID=40419 RepID=A0ACB8R8E1_9AGAM|nr:hypothetical protein FA95DRAFT_884371 [Auriscalpium vulgare]
MSTRNRLSHARRMHSSRRRRVSSPPSSEDTQRSPPLAQNLPRRKAFIIHPFVCTKTRDGILRSLPCTEAFIDGELSAPLQVQRVVLSHPTTVKNSPILDRCLSLGSAGNSSQARWCGRMCAAIFRTRSCPTMLQFLNSLRDCSIFSLGDRRSSLWIAFLGHRDAFLSLFLLSAGQQWDSKFLPKILTSRPRARFTPRVAQLGANLS